MLVFSSKLFISDSSVQPAKKKKKKKKRRRCQIIGIRYFRWTKI